MDKRIYGIAAAAFFIAAGVLYYYVSADADGKDLHLLSETAGTKALPADADGPAADTGGMPAGTGGMPASTGGIEELEEAEEQRIAVHVSGAVKRPGVYQFDPGARVVEAVEAAGGFLEDAAEGAINLAVRMADEQKIHVPTKEEAAGGVFLPGSASEADAAGTGKKININTADAAKLMELPGIGAKKAGSIVQYRESNGSFRSVEDLLEVDGISAKILEGIREYILVK